MFSGRNIVDIEAGQLRVPEQLKYGPVTLFEVEILVGFPAKAEFENILPNYFFTNVRGSNLILECFPYSIGIG